MILWFTNLHGVWYVMAKFSEKILPHLQ